MKHLLILALAQLFIAVPAWATNTYDASKNRLTIDSITLNDITYTNVVVNVGSVISVGGSSPAIPKACSSNNINSASFNAIQVGMSYDQVNKAIGCLNDVSLTMRGSSYVQYVWSLYSSGSLMTSISVFFDATGTTVTPYAATIKSSFGI